MQLSTEQLTSFLQSLKSLINFNFLSEYTSAYFKLPQCFLNGGLHNVNIYRIMLHPNHFLFRKMNQIGTQIALALEISNNAQLEII